MKSSPYVGETAELCLRVTPDVCIFLGGGLNRETAVFSTPSMVRLMEYTARKLLGRHLEPGEESVGAQVSVEHLAATPLGESVTAQAEVTAVDGRLIDFAVTAHDRRDTIGRGAHRRAIIKLDSFQKRLGEKRTELQTPQAMTQTASPPPTTDCLQAILKADVLWVRLHRPAVRNAIDATLTEAFEALMEWLGQAGERVRAVVITGSGSVFCAGEDVKETHALEPHQQFDLSARRARMFEALQKLPCITIAMLNGPAFGGGLMLAASCDFRLAANTATVALPEVQLGWPPAYGMSLIQALVGRTTAMELCALGASLTARKALACGLLHEVVPTNRLAERVDRLLQSLATLPPQALALTKQQLYAAGAPHTLEQNLEAYRAASQSDEAVARRQQFISGG